MIDLAAVRAHLDDPRAKVQTSAGPSVIVSTTLLEQVFHELCADRRALRQAGLDPVQVLIEARA